MAVPSSAPLNWLWIPALVFGHVYAAYWLIRAYALINPRWWQVFSIPHWLRRRRLKRQATMVRKDLYDSLERALLEYAAHPVQERPIASSTTHAPGTNTTPSAHTFQPTITHPPDTSPAGPAQQLDTAQQHTTAQQRTTAQQHGRPITPPLPAPGAAPPSLSDVGPLATPATTVDAPPQGSLSQRPAPTEDRIYYIQPSYADIDAVAVARPAASARTHSADPAAKLDAATAMTGAPATHSTPHDSVGPMRSVQANPLFNGIKESATGGKADGSGGGTSSGTSAGHSPLLGLPPHAPGSAAGVYRPGQLAPLTGSLKLQLPGSMKRSSVGPGGPDAVQRASSGALGGSRIIRRMTTMRVAQLELAWEDLSCTYDTAQGSRVVLSGVCGRVGHEEMLAIMGPSGAGKSTLLDILAMRKTTGNLDGHILVNGQPRSEAFAAQVAYVPQEDNFLPTMTVEETMQYYADLILSSGELSCSKWARCKEVLEFMGLDHALKTLVGGQLPGGLSYRGLSGGERRRLNVAVAVIGAPSMLFLDEPTSGLDSYSASIVMEHMRTMSLAGHSIIATIHQPRPSIWNLFDKALFLSKGLEVYFGSREGILPFFCTQLGYVYRPAVHGTVSDWIMDLINITFEKPHSTGLKTMETEEELIEAAAAFRQLYHSEYGQLPLSHKGEQFAAGGEDRIGEDEKLRDQKQKSPGPVFGDASAIGKKSSQGYSLTPSRASLHSLSSLLQAPSKRFRRGKATWAQQFRVLLRREWISITRNPMDVAGRMLLFSWLGLFTGLLFYKMPLSMEIIVTRLNVLFVEMVVLILLPFVYMSVFTVDKAYFLADISSKVYRPSAYYAAKVVMALPFSFLNSFIFSFLVYGLVGLRLNAGAIFGNAALSFVLYLIGIQVLHCAAVLTSTQDAAFALAIAWTAVNILFSKMYLRYQDLQMRWLTVVQWISATSYAIDGYANLELGSQVLNCSAGFSIPVMNFLIPYLPNTTQLAIPVVQDAITNPGPNCTLPYSEALTYFAMNRTWGPTMGILVAYWAFMHVLTYTALKLLSVKESR